MEKEFIPYEQALALKELGFDEDCFSDYFSFNNVNQTLEDDIQLILNEESIDNYCEENDLYPFHICSAPLYQQAFRWFRENYSLYGTIRYGNNELDKSIYLFPCINGIIVGNDSFKTQEEAELECLKKLIEITKTK